MTDNVRELLAIMTRLRGPDGCPWDRVQTFASIAPYTIEEAYEVADAIERGSLSELKDELGDVLFQVIFQSQLADEIGQFCFDDVVQTLRDKLVRRHPHVFGGQPSDTLDAAGQSAVWENIKAQERRTQGTARARMNDYQADVEGAPGAALSALHGVPQSLPALMRAHKLSQRAARVSFDFEDAVQTAGKVAEELAEVQAAALGGGRREIFEEVGDLLFAAANLARKLEVDAEAALRSANAKFERRFRAMERLAAQRGLEFHTLTLAAQEALWQEVKRAE